MIESIHHCALVVSNLDRSIAFYRDVIGMSLQSIAEGQGEANATVQGIPNAHLRVAFLRLGDMRLEIFQYLNPKGRKTIPRRWNVGAAHLCFTVDNIQKTYEELLDKGVSFVSKPRVVAERRSGRVVRAVYFTDPDEYTLELLEPSSIP